jgi:hypothetical protein
LESKRSEEIIFPSVKGEPESAASAPEVLSIEYTYKSFSVPAEVTLKDDTYRNLPVGSMLMAMGFGPVGNGEPGTGVSMPVLALTA